ncbi:hypothetical protein MNBD_GAMMA01-2114 [hydrothermal vent metagenome]|uniref:Uncharacterized protein n=1 Tax=hydrothermal vent metagenome TaxID=652676 RepID=A0A3B0UQD5_9ZZZZ
MNKMIKSLKLIIILIFISGFGYSIYLNLKLNDYVRSYAFMQVRFPDETLITINSYDNDSIAQENISYHDDVICELKSDLKYLNVDYSPAINEMLYFEKNKKSLLKSLKFKRDNLFKYLEDKEHINCREIGIKIQEIREAKNNQKENKSSDLFNNSK